MLYTETNIILYINYILIKQRKTELTVKITIIMNLSKHMHLCTKILTKTIIEASRDHLDNQADRQLNM